jgi:hypothetical protein
MKIEEKKLNSKIADISQEVVEEIVEKLANGETGPEEIINTYKELEGIEIKELKRILPELLLDENCPYCNKPMRKNCITKKIYCKKCNHKVVEEGKLCNCRNCKKARKIKAKEKIQKGYESWKPPLIDADMIDYSELAIIVEDIKKKTFRNFSIRIVGDHKVVMFDLYFDKYDSEHEDMYLDLFHRGFGRVKIQDMKDYYINYSDDYTSIKSYTISGMVVTYGFELEKELFAEIKNHEIFTSEYFFEAGRSYLMSLLIDSAYDYGKYMAQERGIKIRRTREGVKQIGQFLEEDSYLIFTGIARSAIRYNTDDIAKGSLVKEALGTALFRTAYNFLVTGKKRNFKRIYGESYVTDELDDFITICLGFTDLDILKFQADEILEKAKHRKEKNK